MDAFWKNVRTVHMHTKMNVVTQKVKKEWLLYARHCSKPLGYRREQNSPAHMELIF